MPNFAQLKAIVSRKLIDPSNTAIAAADVGAAINDAIHFWRNRRFWFNEGSASIPLNAGNPLIPNLPADFWYEVPKNGFVIAFNGLSYTLRKVTPLEYDATNVGGLGLPDCYVYRNGGYSIYPIPNLNYTLNCYYLKNYADLANDSDSNDFTNLADQLLIYEALSRLAGEDRQDEAMGNNYAIKADREYKNLVSRTSKQTETGTLAVQTIL